MTTTQNKTQSGDGSPVSSYSDPRMLSRVVERLQKDKSFPADYPFEKLAATIVRYNQDIERMRSHSRVGQRYAGETVRERVQMKQEEAWAIDEIPGGKVMFR